MKKRLEIHIKVHDKNQKHLNMEVPGLMTTDSEEANFFIFLSFEDVLIHCNQLFF